MRYTLLTLFTLFTLFSLFSLFTLFTLFTLFISAIYCNKQYHVCRYILLGKVRTQLERDDELLSKMLGEGRTGGEISSERDGTKK